MEPKTALKTAYKELRLEERTGQIEGTCWMVLDTTNSGSGIFGDEAAGRSHYEKCVMFQALDMIDPEYDWHMHDWHTLDGPATERVAQMLEWRREQEEARAEVEGIHALAAMMVRASKKGVR